MANELEPFVSGHLDLQVKLSYADHHAFLTRHQLLDCKSVLDIGTGNGAFVARLAQDHPELKFVGIDKRRPCIESCSGLVRSNLEFIQVDMFSKQSGLDFTRFDGFLMRYFLLHVDHAQKILEVLKARSARPSKFWVIDLDWSQFSCDPPSEAFDELTTLVKDFCSKISKDSLGGQRVRPILESLGFQNIIVEHIPFSSDQISADELALYLKQEVQCYWRMSGRAAGDSAITMILDFIDEGVRSGKHRVNYGMVLISAQLD